MDRRDILLGISAALLSVVSTNATAKKYVRDPDYRVYRNGRNRFDENVWYPETTRDLKRGDIYVNREDAFNKNAVKYRCTHSYDDLENRCYVVISEVAGKLCAS
jgi:hypothetical protein